jgi:hypothetical protein
MMTTAYIVIVCRLLFFSFVTAKRGDIKANASGYETKTNHFLDMQCFTYLTALILFVSQCLGQKGFPEQFQTKLNISGLSPSQPLSQGIQHLLYDHVKLRARFDIQGWRSQQNETYMIQYKPEGAEADSVSRHIAEDKKSTCRNNLFSLPRKTTPCLISIPTIPN